MAQQFTLSWSNTALEASSNSLNQRALYRYRTVGGAFISTGFTPANDMATSVNSATSPSLDDNKVVQFEVETICTINGPAINDNGIQEVIGFACITPTITETDTTSGVSINVTGLDIIQARFTLRKSTDNTIVGSPIVASVSGTTISTSVTGLTASTNYYWQVELYAIVNGVTVISSSSDYLGAPCSPYTFTTSAPAVCAPVTAAAVSSIEV
jgi:hypothetical protein